MHRGRGPVGWVSGSGVTTRFLPIDTEAVVKAAWDEFRTGLDLAGALPETLRGESQPPKEFIDIELGLAPGQQPSIIDTLVSHDERVPATEAERGLRKPQANAPGAARLAQRKAGD